MDLPLRPLLGSARTATCPDRSATRSPAASTDVNKTEAFFRSPWWLMLTMVIPALLAGAGGIYLAYVIGSQHAEIQDLRARLHQCEALP